MSWSLRVLARATVTFKCLPYTCPNVLPVKSFAEKLLFETLARCAPKETDSRVIVLCYHRIADRTAKPDQIDRFTVFQDDFDAHIQAVKDAGFEIIDPNQIASHQGNSVVITFDDNIPTHVTHALPVLSSHGVTATFFLNPDQLNAAGEMTTADVRSLRAAGMVIGAHNAKHIVAATMEPDDFDQAIDICSDFLQRWGMDKYWAYPGGYLGSFTKAQDEQLRDRGFVRFSTLEGSCDHDILARPQSRYVLRINSSLRYVQSILEGRLRALAKLKQARFAIEQIVPGLARN